MKNINFNLDSIESSYGENILTSIIQVDERIEDLESSLSANQSQNDFEKLQVVERLNKINELLSKIQHELSLQRQKISTIQQSLDPVTIS